MKFPTTTPSALALLFAAASPIFGQNLFVLPGPGGTGTTVNAYATGTLAAAGTFQASANAFRVLSTSDGKKVYVLSASATGSALSVSAGYTLVTPLGNFGAAPTQAVMTPDGLTLYIAAGSLFGFHTANDSAISFGSSQFAGTVLDVDSSVDGTQAFVLSASVFSGTLTPISTVTNHSLATIPIPGTPSNVTVGPNSLVYVSTTNAIVEIDPNTYAVLHQYQTAGATGKPVFTSDGHYMIAANTNASSASALYLVDLMAHSIAGTIASSALPSGAVLDQIFLGGTNLVIGYSKSAQAVYEISLSPFTLTAAPFVPASTKVTAVAVTNDVPVGSRSTVQYLFFAASGAIDRIDLATGQPSGVISDGNPVGALSVAQPAFTGTALDILQYGGNQTVPATVLSSPLVVRALNGAGEPLTDVNVAFTAPAAVTLSTISVNTNVSGYATTTFTATTATGTVQIGVNAGGNRSTFTETIGTVGTGGSGGTGPSSLTVVGGQGMLLYQYNLASLAGSPFSVVVKDGNGNALPNIPVTFQVTQGPGTLRVFNGVGTLGTGGTITAPSGPDGVASVDFLGAEVPLTPGFVGGTVTASVGTGITATIYVTTLTRGNNGSGVSIYRILPEYGTVLAGPAGSTLPGAVQFQVVSNAGPGIPNVGITLNSSGNPLTTPSATCAGSPLSDSKGIVTCNVVLNGVLGTSNTTPDIGYFETSLPVPVQVSVGAPAQFVKIQGDGQSGKYGQSLQTVLLARLEDSFGNPLPGAPVTWAVASGSATLSGASKTTDINGGAEAVVILGKIPGPVTVTITAGTGSGSVMATFTETVIVIPGGLKAVSGGAQTAITGTPFTLPLVAQALDNQNNPVPGVSVTFAVTSGSATLSAAASTADANGNATVNVAAGAVAGPVVVTASYAGFTAEFPLTVNPPGPTNIVFLNGASFTSNGAAPGSITPGMIVAITGDNLTPGVTGVVPAPAGDPLPTTLGGVQVLFGGIPAPLFAVVNDAGREQVNALVPFELGAATATSVTITNTNGSATLLNVAVTPADPGIFEATANSQRYAVLVKVSDGSYVTPQNPAAPGDTVILFAEGLGQATPAISTGTPGVVNQTLNAPVTVTVNGSTVTGATAVYQPQGTGVYLVTFQVPTGLATGIYPLTLTVPGTDGQTYSGQGSFIPVKTPPPIV